MEENMGEVPSPRKSVREKKKAPHQHEENCKTPCGCPDSQAGRNNRNIWVVGSAVLVLGVIFCVALFNNPNQRLPQEPAQSETLSQGFPDAYSGLSQFPQSGQLEMMPQGMNVPSGLAMAPQQNLMDPQSQMGIAPYTVRSPNGPIYQNYASVSPQPGALQPAALVNPHAACPSFTQCFPPATGGMQPVAFTNPHAGCPNFSQCFPQGSAQAVALTNPIMGAAAAAVAPPIFRDAVMKHVFRGVCENCHVVNPDVPIFSTAQPTHGYRGVCSNCHVINVPPNVLPSPMAANAPPIFRDAVMRHAFRGNCENCHVVSPDVPILAGAQMMHEYRGVCSNCHVINGLPATAPLQK